MAGKVAGVGRPAHPDDPSGALGETDRRWTRDGPGRWDGPGWRPTVDGFAGQDSVGQQPTLA